MENKDKDIIRRWIIKKNVDDGGTGYVTISWNELMEFLNSLVVEDEQKNEAFKILQMMIIQDAELYDKLLTATGFAYWFNKLAQLASGVEIDLSEVETDEEISLRMWEEYNEYLGIAVESGICLADTDSFPDWLDKEAE